MFKKSWIVILLVLVIAIIGYNYIYKGHRDIAKEQTMYYVQAKLLADEFVKNPQEAETKYLNKTIEVSGKVTDIGQLSITLNDKVFCQLNHDLLEPNNGNTIKIKGRFIGYDELFEQVKLDQCVIIK